MGSIPRPLRQDGGSALKGTVPAAENAAGTDSLYGQNDGYGREISRFEERIGFVVWAVLREEDAYCRHGVFCWLDAQMCGVTRCRDGYATRGPVRRVFD